MSNQFSPPDKDQIEISVFGPGYGESILIHIGNGNWVIIDSCADPNTKKSVPLQYIEKLGHDPATSIKYVIASHWHDDHVKGIHELLEASKSAYFSCASVLIRNEFQALSELVINSNNVSGSGPKELYKCLETIKKREAAQGRGILVYSTADKTIFRSKKPHDIRLTSLSPSEKMSTRVLEFMAAYMNAFDKGYAEPNLGSTLPNDVAVAVLLEVNGRNIILGSDLEVGKDPLCGWTAVLNGQTLPNVSKSKTFKVAHHGSVTGHHQDVWDKSLEANPWAFLTPFRRGRNRIPNKSERQNILNLTDNAYITACPDTSNKPVKKSPKVQALLSTTVQNLRLANSEVGHIRWRASLTDIADDGQIELFGGAKRLSEIDNPTVAATA